jgi:arsenite methyltransferase
MRRVTSKSMTQNELRDKVRDAYSSAAEDPGARHPFPVGRAFAESVGYPSEWLDHVPSASLDAFAGVSNVPCFVDIPENGTVLDMGCGAGLDSLLLARRMALRGRVIGIDFSWAMLERARCAAAASRTANVLFCQADAERLPLDDSVIDVAVVNGIFNLNPARAAIFRELARCIRPKGRLYGAELILREPLPPDAKAGEGNWFA